MIRAAGGSCHSTRVLPIIKCALFSFATASVAAARELNLRRAVQRRANAEPLFLLEDLKFVTARPGENRTACFLLRRRD